MASGIGGTLRFVGLVTGITGLGAILASETRRHFLQVALASGSPGTESGGADHIVSRIIAGDIPGVVAQAEESVRGRMLDAARLSFGLGFATVLLVAAAIAAVSAVLTFVFVSASETPPARMHQ